MKQKILEFIRRQPRWRLAVALLIVGIGLVFIFKGGKPDEGEITFTVKRGDLQITVLEGGSIEALESQEIRSEVKGSQGIKILKIVEEGYLVTEEDVKKGKILVELDSADLRDHLVQQEIQFQSALATLTDATQGYEIQRNQNISNIKAAEQKSQFARMDAEKFLGDKSALEIIRALKLDKLQLAVAKLASGEQAEQMMLSAMETNETLAAESLAAASQLTDDDRAAKPELATVSLPLKAVLSTPVSIDYAKYAQPEKLGDGSAMQQLRKFTDDLQSSRRQYGLSESKLNATRRLYEKKFTTKTELKTDEISHENNELKVKTAQTAYDLFIKYEFPKQAQELISKFEESLRGLEREKKEAISKLAQSNARLKGAESRYGIESNQRKALQEQMDNCVIKAERPGLVVYGGGSSENYYNGQEQIREGATVRERQPIITIPNMAHMSVKVKVHESYIQKVRKGLKAKIQVDAFPHQKLTGEVIKVALLPDSQNRWMNPDLKVYQTTVAIDDSHDWLKPGMSAKVELMVTELHDVLYVPLQAVTENNGKRFCQVIDGKTEKREIEVGDFNDEFIEIKSGLKSGEKVSLRGAPTEIGPPESNDTPEPIVPTEAKPKTGQKNAGQENPRP